MLHENGKTKRGLVASGSVLNIGFHIGFLAACLDEDSEMFDYVVGSSGRCYYCTDGIRK